MEPAAIHQRLASKFGERITGFEAGALQPWAVVAPEAIAEVASWLKTEPDLAFDNLMCLSAVDYPKETPPRFEVVYHLFSYTHRHVFALKAFVLSTFISSTWCSLSEPSSLVSTGFRSFSLAPPRAEVGLNHSRRA